MNDEEIFAAWEATGYCEEEKEIIAFARLVEARVKEQCAQICEARIEDEIFTGKVDHNEIAWTQWCAAAIRGSK